MGNNSVQGHMTYSDIIPAQTLSQKGFGAARPSLPNSKNF